MVSLLRSSLISCVAASAILYGRDVSTYGEGQDEAIDAPGVAYHPAYKGFPSGGQGPAQTGWVQALLLNLLTPGQVPPGVNVVGCVPKEGTLPIVMIPGTGGTVYVDWAYMAPKLAEEGFCLYSFAHNPVTIPGTDKVFEGLAFLGNITESAYALSAFVDQVLEITGSDQVDFVGHSQGAGALPFYYLKHIMEGNKVRKSVGIAPSVGTELYGLNALFSHILPHMLTDLISGISDITVNALSVDQQLTDSDWMRDLHNGGLTVEGVEYYNIATKYDDVLIPYTNCLFEEENRNITNILLQDECNIDFSDHIGAAFSYNVFQIIRNSLLGSDDPIDCVFTPFFHF